MLLRYAKRAVPIYRYRRDDKLILSDGFTGMVLHPHWGEDCYLTFKSRDLGAKVDDVSRLIKCHYLTGAPPKHAPWDADQPSVGYTSLASLKKACPKKGYVTIKSDVEKLVLLKPGRGEYKGTYKEVTLPSSESFYPFSFEVSAEYISDMIHDLEALSVSSFIYIKYKSDKDPVLFTSSGYINDQKVSIIVMMMPRLPSLS